LSTDTDTDTDTDTQTQTHTEAQIIAIPQKIHRLRTERMVLGKLERLGMVQNLLVDAQKGCIVERRIPVEHLIENNAHAPPVALWPVYARGRLRIEHLGTNVLWRAHGCLRAITAYPAITAHADSSSKISKLDVPVRVQQKIVRLRTSIKTGS
jgi:hypothetical protein